MQQYLDYLRPKPKRERAELTVEPGKDGYRVTLGRRSFIVRRAGADAVARDNYDFALFGALAIALTHNVEITTDLPVSQGAADAVRDVNLAMQYWQSRKIYPNDLTLNNVIENVPVSPEKPGLICLSGGIDSTFAALEAKDTHNITHGLLIAGADYSSADIPGFVSLRARVEKIARILGLELIVVETSIRKLGFAWELLHSLNLAMCLNLNAEQFGYGVIAADQTPMQELAHHPWGNNRALVSAMSNDQFPIEHIGSDHTRSQKTRKIIDHPSGIMRDISVCFVDQSQGGNCGVCSKCIRTRMNILTSGQEMPELFLKNPPLEEFVRNIPIPKYQAKKRKALAQMLDLYVDLPEGAVKTEVAAYLDRLKARIFPVGRQ